MSDEDYFPNGLPRVCNWYDDEDGVKVFTGRDREKVHLLDDHFIICDTKKTFAVNFFEPIETWCGQGPIRIEMYTEWFSNEEEAMEDAKRIQRDLEKAGRFIPIYHRS